MEQNVSCSLSRPPKTIQSILDETAEKKATTALMTEIDCFQEVACNLANECLKKVLKNRLIQRSKQNNVPNRVLEAHDYPTSNRSEKDVAQKHLNLGDSLCLNDCKTMPSSEERTERATKETCLDNVQR